jgi:hypothetical protein
MQITCVFEHGGNNAAVYQAGTLMMEKNPWPIVAKSVAARLARVLLIALLGALADAGLLDGVVADQAAAVVSSFRSSAEAVELPLLRYPSGTSPSAWFGPDTDFV